jgi:hypothetical protein
MKIPTHASSSSSSQMISTIGLHSQPSEDGKARALREENAKLRELLKRNEALIETKLAESKLEQQHIMTICNLMGPIIQALTVNGQKGGSSGGGV